MTKPVYRMTNRDDQLRVIKEHPLASLVTCDNENFFSTQVPLYLDTEKRNEKEDQLTFRGHLSKGNPQVHQIIRRGGCVSGLVIWRGPDAYISPHFFGRKFVDGSVVPTWDYVVVEARGEVRLLDDAAAVEEAVSTLSDHQESRTGGHWSLADAPRDYVESQLRKIVSIEIVVTTSLQGRWKLSQGDTDEDICTMVRGLAARGEVAAADAIAAQRGCPVSTQHSIPDADPRPCATLTSFSVGVCVTLAAVAIIKLLKA